MLASQSASQPVSQPASQSAIQQARSISVEYVSYRRRIVAWGILWDDWLFWDESWKLEVWSWDTKYFHQKFIDLEMFCLLPLFEGCCKRFALLCSILQNSNTQLVVLALMLGCFEKCSQHTVMVKGNDGRSSTSLSNPHHHHHRHQ